MKDRERDGANQHGHDNDGSHKSGYATESSKSNSNPFSSDSDDYGVVADTDGSRFSEGVVQSVVDCVLSTDE
jgi:hypothetical protein